MFPSLKNDHNRPVSKASSTDIPCVRSLLTDMWCLHLSCIRPSSAVTLPYTCFCPTGKPHGADDFLPVLMYVLVRCNMTTLLLDVEYMMELMDPALQLGEGGGH